MIAVLALVGKLAGKLTGELAEHAQTDHHQVERAEYFTQVVVYQELV